MDYMGHSKHLISTRIQGPASISAGVTLDDCCMNLAVANRPGVPQHVWYHWALRKLHMLQRLRWDEITQALGKLRSATDLGAKFSKDFQAGPSMQQQPTRHRWREHDQRRLRHPVKIRSKCAGRWLSLEQQNRHIAVAAIGGNFPH